MELLVILVWIKLINGDWLMIGSGIILPLIYTYIISGSLFSQAGNSQQNSMRPAMTAADFASVCPCQKNIHNIIYIYIYIIYYI